jgi:hypothetical protein
MKGDQMSNRVKTPIGSVFSLLNSRGVGRMFGATVAGVLGTILFTNIAEAQTCAAYTTLNNGTTADAVQVMNNFNTVRNCANTLASGGTLTNTTLSGTITLPGSGVINSTGSVGIGTTTPSAKLHVTTNSSNGTIVEEEVIDGLTQNITTSGSGQTIAVKSSSAYYGAVGGYGNGTVVGMALWSGTGSGVPQFYLTSAGNLGIGTTTPAVTLTVVGDIRTGTSGSNGCVQNFAGTALAGTCSSDARLKTVTGKVTAVLEKLSELDLMQFRWNDTAARLYHNETTVTNTGYIAQSVQKVFPELVSMDEKGYRKLDYTTLQLYGLEAIKELKSENDKLSSDNAALKSRADDNERRLSELESRTGIRSAANVTLLTRFAAAFGW